jgi:hypoxanthine-DNA glycosylase
MVIRGFDPIAAYDARVLVLGSVPGQRSLDAGQYYAHPYNAFWYIVESLFARRSGLDYQERCRLLIRSRVAVWDVLQAADRSGSLDSAIVAGSEVVNDFAGFLRRHAEIGTLFFNGRTAYTLFKRYVLSDLPAETTLQLVCLPSTSPAHASLSREAKLEQWRAITAALAT